MATVRTPMPGSPRAVKAGCSCPVVANHYGRKAPMADLRWWLEVDCPLHAAWLAVAEDSAVSDDCAARAR